MLIDNITGHLLDKSCDELQTGTLDTAFVFRLKETPDVGYLWLTLFGRVIVLVHLEIVEQFGLILTLLLNTPFFYEAEAICQSREYDACDPIKNLLINFFL